MSTKKDQHHSSKASKAKFEILWGTMLLFGMVAFEGHAEVVSPIRANLNDGTVVPLQCLGCFSSDSFYVRTSDAANPQRPLEVGDFEKITTESYAIKGPQLAQPQLGNVVALEFLKAENLYALKARQSDLLFSVDLGGLLDGSGPVADKTLAPGILTKNGLQLRSAYVANGVCGGPVLNIAKQFIYDSEYKPLRRFDKVSIFEFPGRFDVREITQQPGLGGIPNDHFLVCFGVLKDAAQYYEDVQAQQVKKALEVFAKNTEREQIKLYVQSAVQEHLKASEDAITKRSVRLTIEVLRQKGYKITPPIVPTARK